MDKNKDGAVSYDEFKEVVLERIRKDLIQLDDLMSVLRAEFKKVDIGNRGALSPEQLDQALSNLGIKLE